MCTVLRPCFCNLGFLLSKMKALEKTVGKHMPMGQIQPTSWLTVKLFFSNFIVDNSLYFLSLLKKSHIHCREFKKVEAYKKREKSQTPKY